jgi:ubiquinone/menaquinone biosynthesis C-methylase UbiE
MKESPTEKSRRVWEAMAPRYDRAMTFAERRFLTGGRPWVCSRAVGEVLDVGVGTGINLPYYPHGLRITGVDLSPAMLAVARDRATELGVVAELREGDAQALPFTAASFDTVVCTLALCAIPDDRAAVAEMHRVLRPGGRLLLLDHVASTWWPIWALQRLVDVVSVRTAGEHYTRRPLTLLPDAGFEIVESERLRAGAVERVHARKV